MTQAAWQTAILRRSAVAAQARLVEQDTASQLGMASRWAVTAAMAALPIEQRSGGVVDQIEEVRRICGLPIQHPLSPEELEVFRREHTKEQAYRDKSWIWKPEQAEAIMAYMENDGAYLPLRVGLGKTAVLQRISDIAYKNGKRKIVLLLPTGLVDQFMTYDRATAKASFPYDIPIQDPLNGDMGPKKRNALIDSNRKGLHVLTYTILSREVDILERLKPDLILSDESFLLSNFSAALTKRVERYLSAHECQFVAAAGSITKRSISEFCHLIKWALRARSPVPLQAEILSAWAAILDTNGDPDLIGTATLRPLMGWAKRAFPEVRFPEDISGFRKAFRLRLVCSPGVVSSTGTNDLNCSLTYKNTPVPEWEDDSYPGMAELKALMAQVEKMIAPTGDQLTEKMQKFKWNKELSAGIYNDLWWPEPSIYAARKGISVDEAEQRIAWGREHHQANQMFNGLLVKWMRDNPNARGTNNKPIDSPLHVTNEMSRTGARYVDEDLYYLWNVKKSLERPGMAERDRAPVRVCDYKLRQAARWAKQLPKGEGSIIWAENRGVVKWLWEILVEEGIEDALWVPRGKEARAQLRDPANGHLHKAVSLRAYYKGLNLQHHQHMYYVQFGRDAMLMEQSVGRFHRTGQKALSLTVNTCLTNQYDRDVFSACLNDALYQHQIGGGDQKLVYGNYDPPLEAVPPEVLVERGLISSGQVLDQNHRALLREKFGVRS